MIKYREHEGSLQESLDTAREFSTLKDCLQYVQGVWNETSGNHYIHLDDIQISYYGYDDRVKQELYELCISDYLRISDYLMGFIYEETE